MKRLRALISIFLLILSCSTAGGQTVKPSEGFGGLKWGDSADDFKKLTEPTPLEPGVVSFEGMLFGRRFVMIGDESFETFYYFYKNRFPRSTVNKIAIHTAHTFLSALNEKYGVAKESPLTLIVNPKAKVGVQYDWRFEPRAVIELQITELSGEAKLSYTYLPILAERTRDQQEQGKKLKKDL